MSDICILSNHGALKCSGEHLLYSAYEIPKTKILPMQTEQFAAYNEARNPCCVYEPFGAIRKPHYVQRKQEYFAPSKAIRIIGRFWQGYANCKNNRYGQTQKSNCLYAKN